MLAPTKHRFSVKEYYRMAETGVLKPDARVELLNGEIIDMSPIGPFHGGVVKRLIDLFTQASKGRWWVCVQDPVHLDDHSEPEPDLMLLKRDPGSYTSRHPEPEDVYLLVEVSDASLATDREEKLPIYSRAGIAEVWIVNLVDLTVEVYREPHFTGYGSKTILRAGDQARPQAFPDAVVDVAELLKR
ncbi:MAG: Uma2 family endonuclease [Verrucomicrobia bacterium]|nr:MAG: Uma2 family endonuclease [Verrucomicrobiota bacterium]